MTTIHLTFEEIMAMDKRQRTHLINSSGGFKSVCLVGSISHERKTNLSIVSSVVHIGASPPLIAFIVRPASEERHTLINILETGFYTLNHVNETIYRKAHQTSARYPREVSEFSAVGLTEVFKDSMPAPYVQESLVQLGIEFKEKIELTINNTIMIIGQISHLYFPENCWCNDGFMDLEKAGTITCSGLDKYHTTQVLERLTYAKPDREPQPYASGFKVN